MNKFIYSKGRDSDNSSSTALASNNHTRFLFFLILLFIGSNSSGRLAELANEQENQDRELLLIFRQKIQAMPFFWLEMLEIEVLSRYF